MRILGAMNRLTSMGCLMPIIKIKKLKDDAIVPTQGSDGAAGYDLYSRETVQIPAGGHYMFSTGLAMKIPDGFVGLIFARSGLGCKKGLAPRNKVGVIDCDYTGEIGIDLYNDGASGAQMIEKGDRIAQIVITPYASVDFKVVDELIKTDRGANGFGSSGR